MQNLLKNNSEVDQESKYLYTETKEQESLLRLHKEKQLKANAEKPLSEMPCMSVCPYPHYTIILKNQQEKILLFYTRTGRNFIIGTEKNNLFII